MATFPSRKSQVPLSSPYPEPVAEVIIGKHTGDVSVDGESATVACRCRCGVTVTASTRALAISVWEHEMRGRRPGKSGGEGAKDDRAPVSRVASAAPIRPSEESERIG